MSINNEIKKYHDIIVTAGSQAVSELIGTNSFFEVNYIKFDFDYDSETDTEELSLLYISCNFGRANGEQPQYYEEFVLYNIPVYKLDDLCFLYGFFFGAISKYIED